ncbi:MAG: S26 family signal peptidase [Gammaproteobacteria bacterium]|nr:S26 family signal peptidase [Gammaproteobacteria bacterium]MDH5651257.1 S26 family signal peptidase [Gammaproteobacteria bacterium]
MLKRARRFVTQSLIGIAITAISILLLQAALSPWYLFGVNVNESLPGTLYLVYRGELPSRDDIAAFRTPPNPYYPVDVPFIKIVKGVPGDRITRNGQEFSINGRTVGLVKLKTRDGLPLTSGPTGVLPPHHYFFWTSHKDSYDSRYAEIGWISEDRIVGRAVRVF